MGLRASIEAAIANSILKDNKPWTWDNVARDEGCLFGFQSQRRQSVPNLSENLLVDALWRNCPLAMGSL